MEKRKVVWRIYVVFLVMLVCSVGIVARVVGIQSNEAYREVVEKKENLVQDTITPIRGSIFSADGSLLVASDPVFNLRWDATVVDSDLFNEEIDELAAGMSKIFKSKTTAQWKAHLVKGKEEGKRYYKIANKVSRRDLHQVLQLPIFKLGQYKGGLVKEKIDFRGRQFAPLADRTIGYARVKEGKGLTGIVGIEEAYDKQLRGEVGVREMKRLSSGKKIPVSDEFIKVPKNGMDVYSTIDINIQDVAESELMRQLEAQNAANGCAILMEVETGKIIAIANLQKTGDGTYYESYNHAIGTQTEPGSTFKLVSLLVALEDGVIDLDTEYDTEDGTVQFYDRVMRDSKVGGYGIIDVKTGFARSSNTLFSKMIDQAYHSRPNKFVDGVRSLMGEENGISLKGEKTPYIHGPGEEGWSGVSLPWMSIGYETMFTPLQILTLYNAIANDGKMVKPQFVNEIRQDGELVESFEVQVLQERLCSKSTIRKAKQCLEYVVDYEYGTGRSLRASNYKIAGKTGTTQKAQGISGYKSQDKIKYQASFCGYFPADAPRYSCIVVVAAPEKGKYGAEVAGTVFKAIADKVYAISPEDHEAVNDGDVEEMAAPITKSGKFEDIKTVAQAVGVDYKILDEKDTWVMAEAESGYLGIKKKYVGDKTVPNVKGMGLKDALYILENRGMKVEVSGSGKVVSQSIEAGKPFMKNTLITLQLK